MVGVTVVIPCFNAEAFIADACRSLQEQNFPDWECIIVDDCSSDQSIAIIQELAASDPRIRPIRLTENSGPSVARNAGLDAAKGRWITLLDADDLYTEGRLSRLVAVAEAHAADMVFDDQLVTDFPSTEAVDHAFHWIDGSVMPFDKEEYFTLSAIDGRSLNAGYMKPLFRRSFLEKHRIRYDPRFRSGQDYLFYADAFAYGAKCLAVADAGYVYRRRTGSVSRSGGQHLRSHARLSDEVLTRHGATLSSDVHASLARRRADFLRKADLHDLRSAVAARRPLQAGVIVLSRPRVLVTAASTLYRRLRHPAIIVRGRATPSSAR